MRPRLSVTGLSCDCCGNEVEAGLEHLSCSACDYDVCDGCNDLVPSREVWPWGGAVNLSPADDVIIGVERVLDIDGSNRVAKKYSSLCEEMANVHND